MRRELMISGAIGAVGAVVMLVVIVVNDIEIGVPSVLMVVAAALLPLARTFGNHKARQAGRRMRDGG